jgi:transcriptional regulator with XRE-family HTH domain
MKNLSERLKSARDEKGWRKADLMRAAGLKSASTLTDLETSKAIHSPQLPKIAAALGVNVLWLQHGTGDRYALPARSAEPMMEPSNNDPISSALNELERLRPTKAALFMAQILDALQEAIDQQTTAPPKKDQQSA